MALPKVTHPIYEVYLKSLDRKVKFRPFLVKEEKILLMAKESKDAEAIKVAVNQIIENCCIEPINVHDLPLFDVEMFFIHLRAKSVSEIVKLQFTCNNRLEDGEKCGFVTDYDLNLEKIEFFTPEGHTSKIDLGNNVGVKLKYPTFDTLELEDDELDLSAAIQIVMNNIEYIYDAESVYKAEDSSKEELMEFLDSLSPDQIKAVRKFFNTTPKVMLNDEVDCKKCGFHHKLKADGLTDFFL